MRQKIIREYFSFSRKERTAVLILVVLIMIVLLLPDFFPGADDLKVDMVKLKPAAGTLQPAGSPDLIAGDNGTPLTNKWTGKDNNFSQPGLQGSSQKKLFYFDPNLLPVEGWKMLGLRDKTIATIHNYISKGGKFRNREDISKIYGLHADEIERLMPYIRIKNNNEKLKQHAGEFRFSEAAPRQTYSTSHSLSIPQAIDINQADTMQLIALPGIGSKLAARIVLFRQKLGGFYSVNQLSEVYGLPDSTFRKLKPVFSLSNAAEPWININTTEVDQLRQHPYLKWNVAAAIVAYRKQHGNYEALDDLLKIDLVTNEIYQKVLPYLKCR
jgi:DNA uptake protein ComE-like DNA-binding protein